MSEPTLALFVQKLGVQQAFWSILRKMMILKAWRAEDTSSSKTLILIVRNEGGIDLMTYRKKEGETMDHFVDLNLPVPAVSV
jgi:hypothetical protein